MKLFKLVLITLSAVCLLSAKPASEKSIREFMDVTGSGELGIQVMNQMIPSLKQLAPDAPDSFWDDFRKEVSADELISLIVPVYQKHFTEDDMKALIAFYKSEAGKKYVSKLPAISQESMQLGQNWGQQLAQKVLQKYSAEQK